MQKKNPQSIFESKLLYKFRNKKLLIVRILLI